MTPEQKALLQKATASLQAARLLANQEFYDFAISRAYYTMFYVTEAFLLGEGLVYSKHSAVTAAFGQQFVKTGRVPQQFHRYLLQGQSSRHIGDYNTTTLLTEKDAQQQIEHAEQFLQLAAQQLGDLTTDGTDEAD